MFLVVIVITQTIRTKHLTQIFGMKAKTTTRSTKDRKKMRGETIPTKKKEVITDMKNLTTIIVKISKKIISLKMILERNLIEMIIPIEMDLKINSRGLILMKETTIKETEMVFKINLAKKILKIETSDLDGMVTKADSETILENPISKRTIGDHLEVEGTDFLIMIPNHMKEVSAIKILIFLQKAIANVKEIIEMILEIVTLIITVNQDMENHRPGNGMKIIPDPMQEPEITEVSRVVLHFVLYYILVHFVFPVSSIFYIILLCRRIQYQDAVWTGK